MKIIFTLLLSCLTVDAFAGPTPTAKRLVDDLISAFEEVIPFEQVGVSKAGLRQQMLVAAEQAPELFADSWVSMTPQVRKASGPLEQLSSQTVDQILAAEANPGQALPLLLVSVSQAYFLVGAANSHPFAHHMVSIFTSAVAWNTLFAAAAFRFNQVGANQDVVTVTIALGSLGWILHVLYNVVVRGVSRNMPAGYPRILKNWVNRLVNYELFSVIDSSFWKQVAKDLSARSADSPAAKRFLDGWLPYYSSNPLWINNVDNLKLHGESPATAFFKTLAHQYPLNSDCLSLLIH